MKLLLFLVALLCCQLPFISGAAPRQQCRPFARRRVAATFSHRCEDCCQPNKVYLQYLCSPGPNRYGYHRATLTVNNFQSGGSGGAAAECDERYHPDSDLVVAVSTGWYNRGRRCGRLIKIVARKRWVKARVVDECDSVHGCDSEHAFEPPCPPNVVDASPAVWRELRVSPNSDDYGWMQVYWTDA